MEHSTEIWTAFFKTGGMLTFVIAFLLFLLYLLKRFSNFNIIKSRQDHIKVLSVHHFSPKEKVVLMEVMGNTILIGVTSQSIQTLANIGSNSAGLNAESVLYNKSAFSLHNNKENQKMVNSKADNGG